MSSGNASELLLMTPLHYPVLYYYQLFRHFLKKINLRNRLYGTFHFSSYNSSSYKVQYCNEYIFYSFLMISTLPYITSLL